MIKFTRAGDRRKCGIPFPFVVFFFTKNLIDERQINSDEIIITFFKGRIYIPIDCMPESYSLALALIV